MKQMILALLAAGAAWGTDAAVVYRGRLVNMREPQQNLSLGGSKTMTFRFYNDDGVEQNLTIVQEVPLEADGSFTAHLDSTNLTAAIQKGEATQVGLTVGRATKEVQPRRKLLPTARATKAVTAGGLSRGATVDKLTTETLEANQVSVKGNLTVGGTIKPEKAARFERTIGYAAKMADNGGVLALKGSARVFGEVKKLVEKKAVAGEELCTAPADGVAVIYCKDKIVRKTGYNSYSLFGESPNFSVVQFCHPNDSIKVPEGWSWAPPRDNKGEMSVLYSPDNEGQRTFGVYFYKFLEASGN